MTSELLDDAPVQNPGIAVDSYLTPCCTTFDAALFGYKNLTRMTYGDFWAQPGVQHWNRDYIAKAPPVCDGCALTPRKWGAEGALGRRGGDQSVHHGQTELRAV